MTRNFNWQSLIQFIIQSIAILVMLFSYLTAAEHRLTAIEQDVKHNSARLTTMENILINHIQDRKDDQ